MRPVCEGSSCQTGSISDTCQRHASLFVSFHKAQPLPFASFSLHCVRACGLVMSTLCLSARKLSLCPFSLSPSRKLRHASLFCLLPESSAPCQSYVSQKALCVRARHVNARLSLTPKPGSISDTCRPCQSSCQRRSA